MSDAEQDMRAEIAIRLDKQDFVMRPTLEACIAISRIGGGLNAAVQRCQNLDFDTIHAVIVAGLSLNPNQAKQIAQLIYNEGAAEVAADCIAFIQLVANGGKPFAEDDEGDDKNPPPPA